MKDKDNKKNKRLAIIGFLIAICFYAVAMVMLVKNSFSLGIVFLCFGSTFLCLGSVYLNKGKEDDNKGMK